MSEKINPIKETTDVGEIETDASARSRRNGQMLLKVFNSEEAGIAEPSEEISWDTFQQLEDEGSPGNRVVVISEELAQELEAA